MGLLHCFRSFSRLEWGLWLTSICIIVLAFFTSRSFDPMTVVASLIGVTALIFNAKGNVWGQIFTVVFSLLYGIVSLQCRYYGEMITYWGMTMPIAMVSVYTWWKHPYAGSQNEVAVASLQNRQLVQMGVLCVLVTAALHVVLAYFDTPNLLVSTVSVTTSFIASYLTVLRSPYYALGYAANDLVLIVLWTSMSLRDASYVCMVVCFALFLCNDFYGFWSWQRMQKRQAQACSEK